MIEQLNDIRLNIENKLEIASVRIKEIESEDYFIGKPNFFSRETKEGKTKLLRLVGKSTNGERQTKYIGKCGHKEALARVELGDELLELRKKIAFLSKIQAEYNFRLSALHTEFRRFGSETLI